MLPAQLVNVAKASLGALPTTTDFIARLDVFAATEFNDVQRPNKTLFGNLFPLEKRPEGTRKTQQTIYSTVKDFQKILCLQNVDIEDLDIWFRNFAKWTLVANALVDDRSGIRQDQLAQHP